MLYAADVTDKLEVFFVELGGMRQRRMLCHECSDDQAVDASAPRSAVAASSPAASTVAAKPSPPSARELDDKLAALKRQIVLKR